MDILTYRVDKEVREKIYPLLLKNRLYTSSGVFARVWQDNYYDYKTAWLSVAMENNEPIGLSFLPRGCYYGWEDWENVSETYGAIGSFVSPAWRKRGLATMLVDNVLMKSRVSKYTADTNLRPVIEKRWIKNPEKSAKEKVSWVGY